MLYLCYVNQINGMLIHLFLNNKTKKVSIITGSSNQGLQKIESLFKAINYLNSVKFGINDLVLDYLKNEGNYLLDLIKPDNSLQRDITLLIADLFYKIRFPFFLNVNADWRGRLYTHSFFITYQGVLSS
uniref:Plasmid-derived RNA polymerase n=1 Tax=Termitomyces sp. T132 TaxID=2136985 RepID=A0A2R4A3W2_9AGAR|nr:plasmid-derived RNA polymerase [Termitomyces sp. T132]AVR57756.1 plasmid-derived RNA polymerase [Termitomyces sp. T132]